MRIQCCPICTLGVQLNPEPRLATKCFTGYAIQRYQCPNCDCIFGPLDMLNHPNIMDTYEVMSKDRVENDVEVRTRDEIGAFNLVNQVGKSGKYLNFGSGKWSQSVPRLRAEGWDLDAYEPCSTARLQDIKIFDNIADLKTNYYDGIFTNDVLEHLQNPIETIKFLGTLLKENGLQSHQTPCFSYCCEQSLWHIIFPIGRSVVILVDKAGQEIVHRTGNNIILRRKK